MVRQNSESWPGYLVDSASVSEKLSQTGKTVCHCQCMNTGVEKVCFPNARCDYVLGGKSVRYIVFTDHQAVC